MAKIINFQAAVKRLGLQPKENGLPAGPSPVVFLPQRVMACPPILGMFPLPMVEGLVCDTKPHLYLVT